MKPVLTRYFYRAGLLVCAFGMSGCVISVGSKVQSTSPAAPVIVVDSADAATMAEIDAAGQLDFESARSETLANIAKRPNLTPATQVHLVNTTYRTVSFDSNKVDILRKIIARPDFCDATRQAIVSQLKKLSFDSSRQDLLNRINVRLAQNAAH